MLKIAICCKTFIFVPSGMVTALFKPGMHATNYCRRVTKWIYKVFFLSIVDLQSFWIKNSGTWKSSVFHSEVTQFYISTIQSFALSNNGIVKSGMFSILVIEICSNLVNLVRRRNLKCCVLVLVVVILY